MGGGGVGLLPLPPMLRSVKDGGLEERNRSMARGGRVGGMLS